MYDGLEDSNAPLHNTHQSSQERERLVQGLQEENVVSVRYLLYGFGMFFVIFWGRNCFLDDLLVL